MSGGLKKKEQELEEKLTFEAKVFSQPICLTDHTSLNLLLPSPPLPNSFKLSSDWLWPDYDNRFNPINYQNNSSNNNNHQQSSTTTYSPHQRQTSTSFSLDSDSITSNDFNHSHYLWSDQQQSTQLKPPPIPSSPSLKSKSSSSASASGTSRSRSSDSPALPPLASLYNQFKLKDKDSIQAKEQELVEERNYYNNRDYNQIDYNPSFTMDKNLLNSPSTSSSNPHVQSKSNSKSGTDSKGGNLQGSARFERERSGRNRDALLLSSTRKEQAETMLKVLVWHQSTFKVNSGGGALGKTPLIREVST